VKAVLAGEEGGGGCCCWSAVSTAMVPVGRLVLVDHSAERERLMPVSSESSEKEGNEFRRRAGAATRVGCVWGWTGRRGVCCWAEGGSSGGGLLLGWFAVLGSSIMAEVVGGLFAYCWSALTLGGVYRLLITEVGRRLDVGSRLTQL